MRIQKAVCVAGIILCCALALSNQTKAQSDAGSQKPPKPKLTLDEFFNSVSFDAVEISPDGNLVVIATERADWDQQIFRKDLWLWRESEKGGSLVQLTQSGHDSEPKWSPDGKWLVGVSNRFATSWSIGRMDATSGEVNAVNKVDCCTPNWFPDTSNVIFSWRPPGQKENRGNGWTQLWRAAAEGKNPQLVFGEDGRHIYGGHVAPDGKYVLFTGNVEEDGDPGHNGAPMGLMRLADAPIIGTIAAG